MKKSTELVFTGDIGFDRYMDGKWNDEELLSQEICDFLRSADHVIANVEGPLVRNQKNTANEGVAQLLHTMDPDVTKVLDKMNADIWNLCNNHIMDAGADGLAATLQEAGRAGVKTLGVGMNIEEASKPLYLDEAGGIGMFSVGYQRGCKPAGEDKAGCLSWSEMDIIRDVIHKIKAKCRWCIVVSHGGEEFTALPTPYTRDRYLAYLDMGADIVVCHHPHVPMNYEILGEKAIFYSLGNFIFDTDYQRAQFCTDIGVLLKLCLSENEFTFEPMGIQIERGTEHIVKGEVPAIFQDVPKEEYELLEPLAAKMFIAATKRQQIYLNPAEYKDATEEKWEENFSNPKRSGRVPGEALDFAIICPLAEKEKEKAWERSRLTEVKDYIMKQM
nr:CapA family protein [uncultured Blautia sp.]